MGSTGTDRPEHQQRKLNREHVAQTKFSLFIQVYLIWHSPYSDTTNYFIEKQHQIWSKNWKWQNVEKNITTDLKIFYLLTLLKHAFKLMTNK